MLLTEHTKHERELELSNGLFSIAEKFLKNSLHLLYMRVEYTCKEENLYKKGRERHDKSTGTYN